MKKKRAALHNLGCKVNAYETEAMQQMLESAGYEIVPFQEVADVYVVNTCSVTNMADRKSRQMLHRAKKNNPDAIVIAAGCYVQTKEAEALLDGTVDIVIGNNKKHELLERIRAYEEDHGDRESVADINHEKQEYEELYLERTAEHTRAFIKVQDGCNQFCSYCIIPYTRGRVRSRRPEEVVAEVRELAAAGYQEVVLTGIHLSSYGVDFKEKENENLLSLIRQVHEVEGIRRIRLGSLEPRIITDDFAKALASMPKFCPHFHLSLQSGCDETLKRMNRHYTTEEYAAGCDILRRYFDNPAITTDVIVGFPGETEEEFEATKAFLERIGFYEMHIFKYSRRAGTRADRMPEQVPEQIKNVRSEALLLLEKQMSKAYRESFLGKKKTVLLEEKTEIEGRAYMIGHTMEYVKAVVPYADDLKNKMTEGVLKEALNDEVLLLDESWKVV